MSFSAELVSLIDPRGSRPQDISRDFGCKAEDWIVQGERIEQNQRFLVAIFHQGSDGSYLYPAGRLENGLSFMGIHITLPKMAGVVAKVFYRGTLGTLREASLCQTNRQDDAHHFVVTGPHHDLSAWVILARSDGSFGLGRAVAFQSEHHVPEASVHRGFDSIQRNVDARNRAWSSAERTRCIRIEVLTHELPDLSAFKRQVSFGLARSGIGEDLTNEAGRLRRQTGYRPPVRQDPPQVVRPEPRPVTPPPVPVSRGTTTFTYAGRRDFRCACGCMEGLTKSDFAKYDQGEVQTLHCRGCSKDGEVHKH